MATLEDFGFEMVSVTKPIQVHDTKTSIAEVVEKPKEQPESTDLKYNTEYICKLISKDRYILIPGDGQTGSIEKSLIDCGILISPCLKKATSGMQVISPMH
jgi:hypothetical protein